MIPLVELFAGFGYLFGHLFLSRGKMIGWIFKIFGGICWVLFLFQHSNYIFMAVTMAVVLTMLYGLYKWTAHIQQRGGLDLFFEILTIVVAGTIIALLLLGGSYTLSYALETFIVLAEISGTMLLARKHVLGWYAYIVMSLGAGVLVILINPSPSLLLGVLELASIYFYLCGIRVMRKQHVLITT